MRANPASGADVNRRTDEPEEDEKVKAMTRAQLAALLGEVPDSWRLFFRLLALTGLRISEALGLDWEDVTMGERPMLRVRRQFYRGKLKRLKSKDGRRDLPLAASLARQDRAVGVFPYVPAHVRKPRVR